jgi:hypothetical protein
MSVFKNGQFRDLFLFEKKSIFFLFFGEWCAAAAADFSHCVVTNFGVKKHDSPFLCLGAFSVFFLSLLQTICPNLPNNYPPYSFPFFHTFYKKIKE